MLSCYPERSWFRIAKASLIISTRPALTSASGARTAAGSLEAIFGLSDVERLELDGGLGGKAEETALVLPVMRQVLTQPQQPGANRRRQTPGCGVRTAAGSLKAVFGLSDVERFAWGLIEV
jgi:hypothetical protein